jgi:hypothetical protein
LQAILGEVTDARDKLSEAIKKPLQAAMKKSPPFDDKPLRYIVRVDVGHHAWKVSVKRANKLLHKYFTDWEHGGTVPALAAALAYRDKLVEQVTDADYEIWKREQLRPNNTSGTPGVGRYVTRASKNTKQRNYYVWQAYYQDLDGKRRSKGFSESLHGKQGAYELALQFRREGLEGVRHEALQRRRKPRMASSKT